MKAILNNIFFYNKESNSQEVTNTYPRKIEHIQEEKSMGNSLVVTNFILNNPIEKYRLEDWGGEKEYTLSMLSQLKNNDIFFDIGSSVGLISVHAAQKLSSGFVYSFEPDPENITHLENNYKCNQLDNYKILQCAVADVEGKMELFSAGANDYSPSLRKVNHIESTIQVDVKTIDLMIERGNVPNPTVIKIDIEGAEMLALKGMGKLLSDTNRPRKLFIEIHPNFLDKFDTDLNSIIKFLLDRDYEISEIIGRQDQLLCTFTV